MGAKFFDEARFFNTKFKEKSSFSSCQVGHRIYFENVDLSTTSFLDTEIKNMIFQGCIWFNKSGRNMVVDELDLEDKKSENKFLAYEKVEELYRKFKNKYKAENNEPEVSNWHYGEKEMFRKKYWLRRRFPFTISNLYWFSSGYGERPVRSGVILISILLGVSVVSGILGLVPSGNKSVSNIVWIHGLPWSLSLKQLGFLIYNTFENAFFIKDTFFKPLTPAGAIILTITTKLIIPIQVALFVLALRNKFRR